jgi:UMF1 family MFS transporter
MGYLGGGLLLLVNIVLFLFSDRIGVDGSLAVRINLASAGIWWLLFSQVTFRALRPRAAMRALPPGKNYLTVGIAQLRETFRTIKNYPHTIHYLIAYLVFNDGIQTVIGVSSVFGAEELKLDVGTLSGIILMVQFVAYFGAHLFDRIASRYGAKNAIMISLVVWATVTIYSYGFLYTGTQFWLLGAVIALVLGGSQALSRSLFSKMIPRGREAEFFSFYEISERGTSWMGPLVFGLVNQLTGSMRLGILSLIFFFVVGLALLIPVNVKRAIAEAERGD